MRRMLLLLPLLGLAACSRYEGPREVYQKNRRGDRADLPGYTIDEQKQRARERNPLFEDDRELGPKTYIDRPGGVGR
ncbi:MAG: hypothetical protein JWO38_1267 [Gemmataceae bacterium]|nr:hypothetical protein [Gemmataceae bacterium]